MLQLVSGTIGERLGRRVVVRTAYITYALLSLAAAFAPEPRRRSSSSARSRARANAFLTPLLLAGLADLVPPRQLGRAVGTFAAVQTAAIALAPLGGGVLGAIDWRFAFLSQVRRRASASRCSRRADAERRADGARGCAPSSPAASGC